MKIIIFGKFDVLHPGHIYFINQAKVAGRVTVVLESDQAVERNHNFVPFYNQAHRTKQLEQLGSQVYLRIKQDYQQILEDLKPDILYLGHDQQHLIKKFSAIQKSKIYKFKIKVVEEFYPELFKSSKLRNILQDKQSAIYLVDKPKNINSFRAVSVLRKVLDMKKVGFAGILDPLASGLLIMAVGKATRLLDCFHLLPKTYIADILFGQTSDTYDLEGQIEVNKSVQEFGLEKLENNLNKFLGEQNQQAPIYSAKKVAGQKLHKLARAGKEVTAPTKNITIYNLEILDFKYPKAKIKVTASAGTYIRSLAYDLGKAMATGALLADLRRTKIGDFDVDQALPLDKVSEQSLSKHKLNTATVIKSLNQYYDQ